MKDIDNLKLQIDFLREGKNYIAYSPALDLATCGKTMSDAKKSFVEAVELFFETIVENRTYKDVLKDLGWKVKGKEFTPPMIVSREMQSVTVPVL